MEKFEDAALFVWLRLPSTLLSHDDGDFRKRPSNWWKMKTAASKCRVSGLNTVTSPYNHVISLPPCVILKHHEHNSKMTGDCCAFKFLRRGLKSFIPTATVKGFLSGCLLRAVIQTHATAKPYLKDEHPCYQITLHRLNHCLHRV